jgi:hypothetical protein
VYVCTPGVHSVRHVDDPWSSQAKVGNCKAWVGSVVHVAATRCTGSVTVCTSPDQGCHVGAPCMHARADVWAMWVRRRDLDGQVWGHWPTGVRRWCVQLRTCTRGPQHCAGHDHAFVWQSPEQKAVQQLHVCAMMRRGAWPCMSSGVATGHDCCVKQPTCSFW